MAIARDSVTLNYLLGNELLWIGPVMRIILDTNLWSSIGDEGVKSEFDSFIKRRSLRAVVPPSILVEVINLPKIEARQKIIEALAKGPRERLDTEAQSESAEVVSEVRRIRPAWMRRMPDTARVWSLNNFWTKKIWRQALQDSGPLYEYQASHEGECLRIVEAQRRQRSGLLRENFKVRPLTAIEASLNSDSPKARKGYFDGWDGRPVEYWRIANRLLYWHHLVVIGGRAVLTSEDTTSADWVGAYVDLNRLGADPSGFTKFWLEEVELNAMPRNWLRWAVDLMQSEYKITHGNPADAQHSAYLLDCDVFLTADARYVQVLKAVREDAPFPIAEPRLVSGDRSFPVIDRLSAVL